MDTVFLDLEETVIDSWDSGLLVNSGKVRDFLQQNSVKSVHIFSFAIWTDKDKVDFDKRLRPFLKRALSTDFRMVPSVEDMMKVDTAITGVHFDSITDFLSIRGKQGAFMSFCKHHFDRKHNVLVDDVVPNAMFHNFDTGLKLQFVNVGSLK